MPPGFVYSIAVNTMLEAELPATQQLGVLIFAVPRCRASIPFLAMASVQTFADPRTWKFFVGVTETGSPLWATYNKWTGGAQPGMSAWKPPGAPEIFLPKTQADECIGEFSVTWNAGLREWLLLNNCHGAIWAQVALLPWGLGQARQ